MRSLTPEQEQAVARRDGSLLLAAGAGSGKTSVLVERFVRAVRDDGIAPGRILAITFTERAAAELRGRVRARLLELGAREAARDTEGAPIGTFHGFCARLLRVHALTAQLDPEFAILDETAAGRLRGLAFRRALTTLLAETGTDLGDTRSARIPESASAESAYPSAGARREAAVDMLAAYGADRVRGMLLGIYTELRSRGMAQPTLPVRSSSPEAGAGPGADGSRRGAGGSGREVAVARPLARSLQPTLFDLEPPGADPPGADAPEVHAPDADAAKADMSEAGAHDPQELEALRTCALLGELLELFGRDYTELKRARAALDFDDLELFARDLLRDHEGVRRGWSERIELLMVDEFQDTNRRQLELLELLERDNLFTVGDQLQSIYGFRHADVEIFRERQRRLAERGAAIALAHNFRSRAPLIAAVNVVFSERFGDAYTPLVAAREDDSPVPPVAAHDDDPPAPLLAAHEDDPPAPLLAAHEDDPPGPLLAAHADNRSGETLARDPSDEWTPIELLLTDRAGWAQSVYAQRIAGALPPAAIWRQAEARLLAQRVAELIAAGKARAGDVAVLVRAATDLPLYERALEEQGLRTLAAVGSFWGHQQVGDLLAWLRALANPRDELALYSVLASPLVGVSSDGLALIAMRARAVNADTWAALAAGGEELHAELSASDRTRVERFAERFPVERRLAPMLGPAQLLLRALALEHYRRHVLSLNWGERRLANVHKLLRLARRFEAAEGNDLRGFLDHVAERRAYAESSEPHAPSGAEPDAVRLMTIHAAKGLEFPVVCLADLGRALGGSSPDLLVDGERIGLRLARLDGSPPVACLRYTELHDERRRAEAAEEDRILYVAMTRARERLLLSGACDFARWNGGSPINWLAPALVPDLPALTQTLGQAGGQPIPELPPAGAGTPAETKMAGGGARVRCLLNTVAAVGSVLRIESSPAAMLVP